MGFPRRAYRTIGRLAPVLRGIPGRMGEALKGREGAAARWLSWFAGGSDPVNPLVWFHAASVGEARAVEPVMRRIRAGLPHGRLVLSYSSPSLARWPRSFPVEHADYAPAECPGTVGRVFDALRPSALVFSRSDLWPELLLAAADRRIPVAVAGAIVRTGSWRARWPGRALLRPLYRKIAFVGAVSDEQALAWQAMGAAPGAVTVTGDPRHDAVVEHVADLASVRIATSWAIPGEVMVAGSIEAEDEPVVLAAFARVRQVRPNARLLLVPHRPDRAAVERIRQRAGALGVTVGPRPNPGIEAADPEARISSSVGSLSDLYLIADLAYVGGGFGRGGIHAVIEPAAFGIPVIVGPRAQGDADTAPLLKMGGGFALPVRNPGEAMAEQWLSWLANPEARIRAGLQARRTIRPGAARLTADRVLELVAE